MGCPDRRSGMPDSSSTVIAHMEPPSSRKQAKGFVWAPKGPFWGLRMSSVSPGGRIWSQLYAIGPPGLDSWSPHTLTWYLVPSTAQFLSGIILIRAPANYRVVHLVIFFIFSLIRFEMAPLLLWRTVAGDTLIFAMRRREPADQKTIRFIDPTNGIKIYPIFEDQFQI